MVVSCLRFRSKQHGVVPALERQKKVRSLVLQLLKRESFAELINKLEKNSREKVKHDLPRPSPFLESDSTIRLKGRLSKTTVSNDLKNPIQLSAKHPAVVLMLREMHEDKNHEGTEYVGSLVQQGLWVIGLKNAMRNIKSKCVKCRKLSVQLIHPHMVGLPKERVEGNVYPFKKTGVFYFSPLKLLFCVRQ